MNVGSGLTITDSTFQNNQADINGGAIYGERLDAEVVRTLFCGNSAASDGGAIYAWTGGSPAEVDVRNSIFVGNTATDYAGAIRVPNGLTSQNNLYADNSATRGGAIHSQDPGISTVANDLFQTLIGTVGR